MNNLDLNSPLVMCTLGFGLSIGCFTGYEGYMLMFTGDDWKTHFTALLLATGGSFACTGLLWFILHKVIIRLEPAYRKKIAPIMLAGTVLIAFNLGAMPTFVRLGHDLGYTLHLNQGVVVYQEALDKANASSRRALIFKAIIRSKQTEVSNLAAAEADGLVSGVSGRGETWRRLKQGESALASIVEMLEEQEVATNAIIQTATTHLRRMRRSIPTDPNISPLEGLPEYLKAQRAFSNSFQHLLENDVRLQIKTSLEGLEDSIVTSEDRRQTLNLKKVDQKLSSIAESVITALEEQDVKVYPLPSWSMGGPVWTCLKYIGHLWQALGVALSIELVPLFWLFACWAQHRQNIEENIDTTAYTLSQLTKLTEAINAMQAAQKGTPSDPKIEGIQ